MIESQKFRLFKCATLPEDPRSPAKELYYVYFLTESDNQYIVIYDNYGELAKYRGGDGPRGLQGPKGEKGEKGDTGLQGETGLQGIPGNKGEKGATGEKGDRGMQGETGPRGRDGVDGAAGEKGEKGNKGERGERGEKGDRGMQGNSGAWYDYWNGAIEIINNTTGTYTKGDPENPKTPGDPDYSLEYVQTQTVLSGYQGYEIQKQIDNITKGISESKLYLTESQYDELIEKGYVKIGDVTYYYRETTEYNVYEDEE